MGAYECRAWVTYYRREWGRFLVAAVGLVRGGFRMRWDRTLYGAWLVLRANQLWAPSPVHDADGARRCMERFYRLVAADSGESLDTVEAARLEVDWWRAHREHQHRGVGVGDAGGGHGEPGEDLVDALTALYAFVYRCPANEAPDGGRPAGPGHGRVRPVGWRGLRDRQSHDRRGASPSRPLLCVPARRGPPLTGCD